MHGSDDHGNYVMIARAKFGFFFILICLYFFFANTNSLDNAVFENRVGGQGKKGSVHN